MTKKRYDGHELLRGAVNASKFSYKDLSASDAQGKYSFNASVYFYPKVRREKGRRDRRRERGGEREGES